ncbi:unnamed protein product [Aureobasidium uvarum]|uniref:MYND-type domain-containing protein n=1 Tax=Aureobasidium uvarum TaxID=2773716 RepID=A0A9N8KB59_9PEZI|nr:unnamed protein product [Aureobasidium uvarum]
MLIAARLNIKPSFYPIRNTPAVNLLRDHVPGVDSVEILAIGCGDVRNILFTIWSEQRRACKLNFTACDFDAAVLAITHDPTSELIERLWRIYYHFYVTSTDLTFVQQHCNQLVTAAESISKWNDSSFGSSFKFSGVASLFEVRRIWALYAQSRTTQEDDEVRQAIKSVYDRNKTVLPISGVRHAGAHGASGLFTLGDAYNAFWRTGVVAGNDQDVSALCSDNGGRVNPLMSVSQSDHFDVFNTTDPLVGFHLAEVFDRPQSSDATTDFLARLAKSQFSEWCQSFASCVASSSVNIMHHCGDAVNFSYALQAIQGFTSLPSSTYFYTKPYSAVPLEPPSTVAASYDVIDTSNVMNHIGLLALLPAVVPLLSERPGSILYTENLVQGSEKSERLLETLLHSNVTMSSLLFGVAPTGYILGATADSTLLEQMSEVELSDGSQKQYRIRIPWQRAAQGDSTVPDVKSASYRLNMEPHELASFFMQIYLDMFCENEDLSIRTEVLKRKSTRPLAGDVDYYSRLTLVTLIASAKRTISTDWQECVNALMQMIKDDKSLYGGSKSLVELTLHLHLSGIRHVSGLEEGPSGTAYVNEINPSCAYQVTMPGTVHVALIVPRSSLSCLTRFPVDLVGTPGVHLWLRNTKFEISFFAIDLFFGHFKSENLGEAHLSNQAEVIEDARGWSGDSDLIVTCKMPTYALTLDSRENVHIELDVNTSRPFLQRAGEPGVRFGYYSATLDSKNVRVLTQAPSTKPSPVLDINYAFTPEPPGSGSADVALNPDGTVLSIGVTNRFAHGSEESLTLKNGGIVEVLQISPCVLAVSIGKLQHASKFFFPLPVNGAAHKMKIARKSSWIEIKVPTSNALQPGGFNLDPFPIINQNNSFLAWGMGRVNPDLQPKVNTSASTPAFLQSLCVMSMSKRERAQMDAIMRSMFLPPMIQLKGIIRVWFLTHAGIHPSPDGEDIRLFTMMREMSSNKYIPDWMVIAKALRHDRDTGSVFLDAFFVPSTPALIKLNPYKKVVNGSPVQNTTLNLASKETMDLWQQLVPALAERCRSWEHVSDCVYRTNPGKKVLCDCGLGKDASSMPDPYKEIASFATRIAIPILFAVPYVEAVGGQEVMSELAAALMQQVKLSQKHGTVSSTMAAVMKALDLDQEPETAGGTDCDHCGSDKPGLKVCARCEKAKYCNRACQEAAWKTHKKVCKRW